MFAVDWDDLALTHVESFLADAEEEGLTWEAKGGEAPHPESVTKAVCGFANSRGGYLLLGVAREPNGWVVTGMTFPGDEANTWITSVISGSLRPVPQTDVKSWTVDGPRALAVVRVEPVALTPCMTSRGLVYERTSGQTITVTDPSVLARLYDQGERARERAERIARGGLSIRPEQPSPGQGRQHTLAAITMAATGLPDDVSRHLFASSFATETFSQALRENLHVGPLQSPPLYTVVSQDSLTGHLRGHDATWIARAAWNGSVAFAYDSIWEETSTEDLISILRGGCTAGLEILRGLQTSGPAYLAVEGFLRRTLTIPLARWISLSGLTEEDLDSMRREIERAQGRPAWES